MATVKLEKGSLAQFRVYCIFKKDDFIHMDACGDKIYINDSIKIPFKIYEDLYKDFKIWER